MRSSASLALLVPALLSGLSLPLAAAPGLSSEQRIERLERRVDKITDLTLAQDALREENRRLRGEIETLQYELNQLQRKQRDIYLDLDQRLSNLSGSGGSTAAAPTPAATAKPDQPAEGSSRPAGAGASVVDTAQMQQDYDAAYALLAPQVRRYGEAAKAFEAFIQKYPQSKLTPNAYYWLGESHYVSQKNRESLVAFERLISDYPGDAKVPGALYKIGRIQASSGDSKEAIATFERLIKDYPDAPAAGLGRDQLNQLKKGR